MHDHAVTHPSALSATTPRLPARRIREEVLLPLSALLERTQGPTCPPADRLPAAFRHLTSRWADLDRFVAELIERALQGDAIPLDATIPEDYARLRGDLARLVRDEPGVAEPYIRAFVYLDAALDILRGHLAGWEPGQADEDRAPALASEASIKLTAAATPVRAWS